MSTVRSKRSQKRIDYKDHESVVDDSACCHDDPKVFLALIIHSASGSVRTTHLFKTRTDFLPETWLKYPSDFMQIKLQEGKLTRIGLLVAHGGEYNSSS